MTAVLVGLALKSVIVLAAAGIVAVLVSQWSAAARHLIWTAAAVALLALPLLSISLPSLHFAPADRMLAPGPIFRAESIAGPAPSAPAAPARSAATPLHLM